MAKKPKQVIIWTPNEGPQHRFMRSREFEVLFGGSRGGGKLSPCNSYVLSPKGFKKMGDLSVGDSVTDPTTGGSSEVIAIYPQGMKDIWRVTFDDGASLEVGDEHLWLARRSAHIRPGTKHSSQREYLKAQLSLGLVSNRWHYYKVNTTATLRKWFEAGDNIRIPLSEPVIFTQCWREMSASDPYLLGLLLGDGHLNSVTITSADDEIATYLEELGFRYQDKYSYYLPNGNLRKRIRCFLSTHGLLKCRSWEKFIPESIKHRPLQDRVALLQGLMDTDGTVDDRGHIEFCTTSEQLAMDVQWVARSLGCKAGIRTKNPHYTYKEEKKDGRKAYMVRIVSPRSESLFRLTRKRERCLPWNGGYEISRKITQIEYVGKKESQCIQVSSPYGLYVADDFIVTHNTEALIAYMTIYANNPNYSGLLLRRTFPQLLQVRQRCKKLYTKIDPGCHFNKDDNIFELSSGATIQLGHVQHDDDVDRYQGFQYQILGFEELTQFKEQHYEQIKLSCRSGDESMIPMVRATANPGGIGHCVPCGDVMTPDGWRDIKELAVGDVVYSLDSQCNLVEAEVSQTHKSHYIGDMIHVVSRGLDITCTPNHKLAKIGGTKDDKDRKFSLVKFEDLPGQSYILRTATHWDGVEIGKFSLEPFESRKTKLDQPHSVSGELFCELLGWFLSEGYVLNDNGDGKTQRFFGIAQSKPEGISKITSLLDKCGFHYKWREDSVIIYSGAWWLFFKQFGRCRDKFIPKFVKNATRSELACLLDGLMNGDGHWVNKGKSGQYYTISKQLADDVCEILVKLGYFVKLSSRQREDRNGPGYCVSFKPKPRMGGQEILTGHHIYNVSSKTTRRTKIYKEQFDGDVFCIGVENTHNFIIRQNGSVWVSGNSFVKKRFIDVGPPETVFEEKLPDGRVLTRKFIKSTVYDNPKILHNDPQYLAVLQNIQDPRLRAMMLEGDWDAGEGLFFNMFEREKHTRRLADVFPMGAPRDGMPIYASMDWGYSKPFAIYWHTIDRYDKIITFKEWYGIKTDPIKHEYMDNVGIQMIAKDVAQGFLQRCQGMHIEYLVVDPSVKAKSGLKGKDGAGSILEEFQVELGDAGIPVVLGNNNRKAGWMQMKTRLSDAPDGKPWWMVTDNCIHLIRTITTTPEEVDDPDDCDSDSEDHAIDSVRYFMMQFPLHTVSESLNRQPSNVIRLDQYGRGPRTEPSLTLVNTYH